MPVTGNLDPSRALRRFSNGGIGIEQSGGTTYVDALGRAVHVTLVTDINDDPLANFCHHTGILDTTHPDPDNGGAPLSVRNTVSFWGYNMISGTTNGRVNNNEHGFKIGIESHYWNGTFHLVENNHDYVSRNGLVNRRIYSMGCDLNTHEVTQGHFGNLYEIAGNAHNPFVRFESGDNDKQKISLVNGLDQEDNILEHYADTNFEELLFALGMDGGITTPSLSSLTGRINVLSPLGFRKVDAPSNQKNWSIEQTNTQLLFRARNDDYSSANNAIEITRSDAAITKVRFPGALVAIGSGAFPAFLVGEKDEADSTDVLGIGGATSQLRGNSPSWVTQNKSAPANNRIWTTELGSNTLVGRICSDDLNSFNTYMMVTRSGTSVSNVRFYAPLTANYFVALSPAPAIAAADGTLADLTAKFNLLRQYLSGAYHQLLAA